jgi:hypothetical protein
MDTQNMLKESKHRFVDAYIENGGNGRQAAIVAGYSVNSAGGTAYRLLQEPEVKAELERRRNNLAARSNYNSEMWLNDVQADIDLARQTKNMSAVMRGHELVGRAIHVFEDSSLSEAERSAFTFLGESMVRSITDNGGINALTQGRRREIELDPQA